MIIGLVAGASCWCATQEEGAGPSVVSLVRSLVSRPLAAAPSLAECMAFSVGRRGAALVSTPGDVRAPMSPWIGVFHRCAGPEEGAGPSVVSLVRSLVSECLWPAPEGSERMVFRVGRGLSAVRCSLENV